MTTSARPSRFDPRLGLSPLSPSAARVRPVPLHGLAAHMATTARPHHRVSSIASSTSSDKLSPLAPSSFVAAAAAASSPIPASATSPPDTHATTTIPAQQQQQRSHQQQRQQQHPDATPPPSVHPSILQPRVAVVLNVPPPWHPWLFALRLCSILPALWWGLPCALELLLRLLPNNGPGRAPRGANRPAGDDDAVPFALTEGALATIWVRAYPQYMSVLARERSPLTMLLVLCVRIPRLLLHRLPHVQMVCASITRKLLVI